jgi:hypothetical protein
MPVTALAPKASVSTSFTTPARRNSAPPFASRSGGLLRVPQVAPLPKIVHSLCSLDQFWGPAPLHPPHPFTRAASGSAGCSSSQNCSLALLARPILGTRAAPPSASTFGVCSGFRDVLARRNSTPPFASTCGVCCGFRRLLLSSNCSFASLTRPI